MIGSEETITGPLVLNGVSDTLGADFKIFSADEVEVAYLDDEGVLRVIPAEEYSIDPADLDQDDGFDVVLSAPEDYPSGDAYVYRRMQFTQLANFETPTPHNLRRAMDRMAMRTQQLKEQTDRALLLSFGESADPLPPAAQRVNTVLGFGAAGELALTSVGNIAAVAAIAEDVQAVAAVADDIAAFAGGFDTRLDALEAGAITLDGRLDLIEASTELATFNGMDPTGVADDAADWASWRTEAGTETYKKLRELGAGLYKSSTGFQNWNLYRVAFQALGEVRLRNTGNGDSLSIADAADYLALAMIRGWPMIEGHDGSGNGLTLRGATHFYIEANVRGAGRGKAAIRVEFGVAGLLMRPMASSNHQHPSPQGWFNDGTGQAQPWNGVEYDQRNALESSAHTAQLVPIYEGVENWGWIENEAIGIVSYAGTSEGNGRTAALGNNPLTTANGSPTVTVAHANHGLASNDLVLIAGAAAVNGITPAGRYPITVTGTNAYTITHSANANAAGAGGGAGVTVKSGGGFKQTIEAFGSRVVDLDWEVNAAADALISGASAELRGVHSDTVVWVGAQASDVLLASGDFERIYVYGADVTVGEGVRFNRFGSGGLTVDGVRVRINGALDVVNNNRHYRNDEFCAHRNGTDQTSIATATFTKLLLTQERWDSFATFDTTNSRWIPKVVGKVRIFGQVWLSGLTINTSAYVSVYKNGGSRCTRIATANGDGIAAVPIDWMEDVDGDDYLEIYVQGITAGTITANGNAGLTFVEGHVCS